MLIFEGTSDFAIVNWRAHPSIKKGKKNFHLPLIEHKRYYSKGNLWFFFAKFVPFLLICPLPYHHPLLSKSNPYLTNPKERGKKLTLLLRCGCPCVVSIFSLKSEQKLFSIAVLVCFFFTHETKLHDKKRTCFIVKI